MLPKHLKRGACVWAPREGYSQWPALIVRRMDVPISDRKDLPRACADNKTVLYFGVYPAHFAAISIHALEEYNPGLQSNTAVGTACRAADAHIKMEGLEFQRNALRRVLSLRLVPVAAAEGKEDCIEETYIDGNDTIGTAATFRNPKQVKPKRLRRHKFSGSTIMLCDTSSRANASPSASTARIDSFRKNPRKTISSNARNRVFLSEESLSSDDVQAPRRAERNLSFRKSTAPVRAPSPSLSESPSPLAPCVQPVAGAPSPMNGSVPLLLPVATLPAKRPRSSSTFWRDAVVEQTSDERDVAAVRRVLTKASRCADELSSLQESLAHVKREHSEFVRRNEIEKARLEERERLRRGLDAEREELEEVCNRLRSDKGVLDIEILQVANEKLKVENENRTLQGVNRGLRRENRALMIQHRALNNLIDSTDVLRD